MSQAAEYFISKCFKDGKPCVIMPVFDNTYYEEDKKYKFTREIFNEVIASGKVKVNFLREKHVGLVGLDGGQESES